MHINSILLVDDDQNIRAISEMSLEAAFDVYVAAPGKDCLLAAEYEQPDLILLDAKLPVAKALTTVVNLRKNPLTANIIGL
jgi:DNA-binding response OmpR family regulator